MDISNRFSLADFLAYLFPGVFTATGLYFLLLLTPLETLLVNLPTNVNTGILFLVFSFVLGVIVSGVAEICTRRIRHKKDTYLPLNGFEKDVKKAFKNVFGGKDDFDWTRTHFYLCRSVVLQYMPNETHDIQRQNSLRQLRMNILPAILIWTFAGSGWGWRYHNSDMGLWGMAMISISILVGTAIFVNLVNRMQNNDEREIRETLTAFLVGSTTGLYKREKNSPNQNK